MEKKNSSKKIRLEKYHKNSSHARSHTKYELQGVVSKQGFLYICDRDMVMPTLRAWEHSIS
jgi:hypothetical protein